MTKRRQDMRSFAFKWVGADKESAIVHGNSASTPQEIYAATVEQLFEVRGADAVASFLAGHLRLPAPHPDVIATVARWLDPQTDDHIKLVVARRRLGKTTTKRVNDAAMAKAVKIDMQARGNKHGDRKKAVDKVAKQFGVSKATVNKAIGSK